MEQSWDISAASRIISNVLNTLRPDVVLTFDSKGVTRHPNHIATHHAVWGGVMGMAAGATPAIYTIDTLPPEERFFFPLHSLGLLLEGREKLRLALVLCAPGLWPWSWCNGAMQQHWSQYVWHRVLWVTFSSYALVNVLRMERKAGTI